MTIKHEFELTAPEGQLVISISDWVKTLPEADQDLFAELDDERHAQVVKLVDEKKLTIAEDFSYIWLDHTAEKEFDSSINPGWVAFWNRYIAETGIAFNLKKTEE